MTQYLSDITTQLGLPLWVIILALTWSLFWKALAMWKSARLNQPIWFIIILIVNTLGILEILYIFLFSKINRERVSSRSCKGWK